MVQLSDLPRVLPELLLVILALLVLGSDIFERWANTPAARSERSRAAGSLTAIGLGMVFAIVLLQSGYVYQLPDTAPVNIFTNIIRNLQAGGPGGDPVAGVWYIDNLTSVSRLILIGAAFIASLIFYGYEPKSAPAEFYAMLLFSTAGMCLMAGAGDLLIAYLAIELTSIPLYVLVGYLQGDRRSAEAGMKYFLFGAISSAILLYGMSLAYGAVLSGMAGSMTANNLTNFSRIAVVLSATEDRSLFTVGLLLIIAGMGYKIAAVPFHSWAPDVYQGAPAPVTAFLSTASKAAGFLLLYRLLAVAYPELVGSPVVGEGLGGWSAILGVIAATTLVIANLAALPQTNVRRLLGYSSIAHAGFILMGLMGLAATQQYDRNQAVAALLYYVLVYTITNLGAFGALTAINMVSGNDDLSDLRGLARRNLPLALLLTICILSLAGIPPLAGFFAKFFIFMVAWQAGAQPLVVLAVTTTVVALYYYLRLLKAMFIEAPTADAPISEPPAIRAALILTVVMILAIGVVPNLVLSILGQAHVTGI